MNKNYINNYLIANGKYFPSNKLDVIGNMLEKSNLPEYSINVRFFNPLTTTIIFWVFYPIQVFDRLILKDWVLGALKLGYPLLVASFVYLQMNFLELDTQTFEIIIQIFAYLFIPWGIWTVIDGFTIYSRTKYANFNALKRALNKNGQNYVPKLKNEIESISNGDKKNNEFLEWKKNHPNSTINDFYKWKKF